MSPGHTANGERFHSALCSQLVTHVLFICSPCVMLVEVAGAMRRDLSFVLNMRLILKA